MAGPVDWALKTTLLANLTREHNPALTWPDEPLDPASWKRGSNSGGWLDQSTWHMVVKPGRFIDSLQTGIVWGVVTSRFGTFHDIAHALLEDAELSVTCERYLDGDPDPWEGFEAGELRHGALMIDIVDKSGVHVGTSHGGTIFDGLKRTVVEFADDFIDSTEQLLVDAETPVDYFAPGNRFTAKEKPYVVFREGETSPIQTSQWIHSPSKGVQVIVGGHSMPGVNELISTTIAAIGDLWGQLVLIGSLGSMIDQLLKPLYEDTILAWQVKKSTQRSENSGFERLFEYFQQGANNAYTVACQKFDTVIDGPDGKERIDVLAERGEPFRVWSLTPEGHRVPAWATLAFKKGTAELFNYVLEDGRVATVTKTHRFLTPQGYVRAGDLSVGSRICVVDWNAKHADIPVRDVKDDEYVDVASPSLAIVDISSDGVHDFYDMNVPGWQNYSANGIWGHNSLMVLRAGFWATKTTVSWKAAVADGQPYLIGDKGLGHFWLDDRVGLVLKGDDQIHMDRARKIDLAWNDETPPEWQITIGDDRNLQDPTARAFGRIEKMIAGMREAGVW